MRVAAAPRRYAACSGAIMEAGIEHIWKLKRSCNVYPHQFLGGMAALIGLCMVVALCCWLHGLWLVPIFALIEAAVIAAAFLSFARHARDGETVILYRDGRVRVEVDRGLEQVVYEFTRHRARLVQERVPQDSLWLYHGTGRVRLGEFVPLAQRWAFMIEWRGSSR
jgi:uncharacterized membrane protein